jgi:hypothetical protein
VRWAAGVGQTCNKRLRTPHLELLELMINNDCQQARSIKRMSILFFGVPKFEPYLLGCGAVNDFQSKVDGHQDT